jgi:hypothetical protein
MDGKTMGQRLLDLLNEASGSALIGSKITYDFFYDAARDCIIRTECCTDEHEITTIDGTADYSLPADYIGLYFKHNNKYHIKLNTGGAATTNQFVEFRERDKVYYDNDVTEAAIANYFTLKDAADIPAQVTGTASAAGAATGGKCLLTTAVDKFDNVFPGDNIHNTTDVSSGVVISKTDAKNIYVALFGGTVNAITNADAFIIQPRARVQLQLDPPPSTSDYTYYVPYIQMPSPVYSLYDVYRIPFDYTEALANYAAWKYKERDKAMDFGKSFLSAYMAEIAKYLKQTNRVFARQPARMIPKLRRR